MAVSVTPTIEFELSGVGGGWTAIPDVRLGPYNVTFTFGINGTGPADCVADVGTLRFVLDNSNRNSGLTLGWYSLNNASKRSGFGLGIRVRYSLTSGGSQRFKFIGTLDSADPVPDLKGERVVMCSAVDYMDELNKYKLVGLPTLLSTNAGAVINQILAAAPRAPNATSIQTGSDAYPFAMANQPTEDVYATSELQRLCMTEGGKFVITGSTVAANAGQATFYNRVAFVTSPLNASIVTLADSSIMAMKCAASRDKVLNVFRMTSHPRTADSTGSAPVILYTLTTRPSVDAGQTIVFLGKYVDPNQLASQVGGYNMISPVLGTDYTLNSNPDGSGTDLSGSVSLSAALGSDGVQYTVTNSGGVTCFVGPGSASYLGLVARGFGLYDYQPVSVTVRDPTSVTANGEHAIAIDMWYQPDSVQAKHAADYMLPFWKDALTTVESVTFLANLSSTLMSAALDGEPCERVTIQETLSGLNKAFHIQGGTLTLIDGRILTCTWNLSPQADTTSYWIWDTSVWDTGKWFL